MALAGREIAMLAVGETYSLDTVDQARGIKEPRCFINLLFEIERDFYAFANIARICAGLGRLRGTDCIIEMLADFVQKYFDRKFGGWWSIKVPRSSAPHHALCGAEVE